MSWRIQRLESGAREGSESLPIQEPYRHFGSALSHEFHRFRGDGTGNSICSYDGDRRGMTRNYARPVRRSESSLGKKGNQTILAAFCGPLDFDNEFLSVPRNQEIDLGTCPVAALGNTPAPLPKSIAYKALELGFVVFRWLEIARHGITMATVIIMAL